jgi:hypothetical protein
MGLSLEFYAGDAAAIGHAVTEVELDGIRDGTEALAYADFSLHLHATDLDALSEVVAERLGVGPLLLSECLISEVGSIDDGQTGEADVVDPDWVEMVASLREEDAGIVAVRWFEAMTKAHRKEMEVTEDAIHAIVALIRLCQAARSASAEVVHVWYL